MKLVLENIELAPGLPEEHIGETIRNGLLPACEFTWRILRKSLDARDKNRIVYRCRVLLDLPDEAGARLLDQEGVAPYREEDKPSAPQRITGELSVIIVGSGPAGLFCALRLVESGARVTIVERGRRIDERTRDLSALKFGGTIDPESNVLFGEGGAGAYSDGKLLTRIHRPEVAQFFNYLAELGAPHEIQYEHRPHLGTDRLMSLIKALRARIEKAGGRYLFNERAVEIISREGRAYGVRTASGQELLADALVLATGHSARDIYELLARSGIALEKKGFAVGVRIEHPAELISFIQYGPAALKKLLPAADYRLSYKNPASGRGVYSFCMCPGGQVINSSSEEGMLCVNGMSYSTRSGAYSNAAIVVSVSESDISGGALAGVEFQRQIESKAFKAGGGGFYAPAQRITSLLSGRVDDVLPAVSYEPGARPADMRSYLPPWAADEISHALKSFDRSMKGFICDQGVVIGAETRTSSPVRIPRGEDFQSLSLKGLFPAGEGAGYAGGIVSSAVDGMRTADAVCALHRKGRSAFHTRD